MDELSVGRWGCVGLLLVSLSTLMYEILLTRIFSVMMLYHYAFFVISLAMFGMTLGALIVYLSPKFSNAEQVKNNLAIYSALFAASICVCFLVQLQIPVMDPYTLDDNKLLILSLVVLVLMFFIVSIPFVFSGICVTLALTKFPKKAGMLYAFDLIGAAIACVLIVLLLDLVNAPAAVIMSSVLAGIGAVFFALEARLNTKQTCTIAAVLLLLSLFFVNECVVDHQSSLLRIRYIKQNDVSQEVYLYEKWNSFSRITILNESVYWSGWGVSHGHADEKKPSYTLRIDNSAATHLVPFDGENFSGLDYMRYDIINFVHHLKKNSSVLVVGAGGGRDILSALLFNQSSVVGIELNEDILYAANDKFGDFTGHLDKNPKVEIVNDEARSYLRRQNKSFDIIQISLVDTWAASSAGAFVFSENSLYTIEAWAEFIEHLKPNGVLSVSRWYIKERPAEIYRLISLASSSMKKMGVENPENNIVVLRSSNDSISIGNLILSNAPFSDDDLDQIENAAEDMNFTVVFSPRRSEDAALKILASGKDSKSIASSYQVNLAATTDDSPFFFNLVRIEDIINVKLDSIGEWVSYVTTPNARAFNVLVASLLIITALMLISLFGTLFLRAPREGLSNTTPLLIFFAFIGVAFMLIEVSQIQRLIIFLGHPTYSLSVVLFSLLLASGIGSYSTTHVKDNEVNKQVILLSLLVFVVLLFGLLTPSILDSFKTATTPSRILVSAGILLPLGFFMGMAFPLGMRLASTKSALLMPWLWGVNGAASVFASILAVMISMTLGITASFYTGLLCYIIAVSAFIWSAYATKKKQGDVKKKGAPR